MVSNYNSPVRRNDFGVGTSVTLSNFPNTVFAISENPEILGDLSFTERNLTSLVHHILYSVTHSTINMYLFTFGSDVDVDSSCIAFSTATLINH